MQSTPPIKEYDIVPDVWNTHAHVTVGELLANDQYREELRTALHTIDNHTATPPVNKKNLFNNLVGNVRNNALTMAVRIANVVEDMIPDSGAAVSVITRKKAIQLGLNIDPVNTLNLTAYGSPLGVVGTIREAPLRIKDAKIPIDLQVVEADEGSILLGMD